MNSGSQHSADLAWQNAHPVLMVLFSTIATLLIFTAVMLVRWIILRKAWRFHPQGAVGVLNDEVTKWGLLLLPLFTAFIVVKLFIFARHPEFNRPEVWLVFGLVAITYRFLVARAPVFKSLGLRVDGAVRASKAHS